MNPYLDSSHLNQAVIEPAWPGFYAPFHRLAQAAEQFCEHPSTDAFVQALLCQSRLLWDRFQSLVLLACTDYGPSSTIIYRSLIELSASIIYLSKDRSRLHEFEDAGVKAVFEHLEHCGLSKQKLAQMTADYQAAKARWPRRNWFRGWHGLKKMELFDRAGFNDNAAAKDDFYKTFYPEASDIAHAGALLTTCFKSGTWSQEIVPEEWPDYGHSAMGCGYLMTIHTLLTIDRDIIHSGIDFVSLATEGRVFVAAHP